MLLSIIALSSIITATLEDSFAGPQQHAQEDYGRDHYGAGLPVTTAASSLRAAARAPSGSWARRNVLASAAQSSWQRRLSGNASEADFAVLRAARPGIASSMSGPIGAGWSGSPWNFGDPPADTVFRSTDPLDSDDPVAAGVREALMGL